MIIANCADRRFPFKLRHQPEGGEKNQSGSLPQAVFKIATRVCIGQTFPETAKYAPYSVGRRKASLDVLKASLFRPLHKSALLVKHDRWRKKHAHHQSLQLPESVELGGRIEGRTHRGFSDPQLTAVDPRREASTQTPQPKPIGARLFWVGKVLDRCGQRYLPMRTFSRHIWCFEAQTTNPPCT